MKVGDDSSIMYRPSLGVDACNSVQYTARSDRHNSDHTHDASKVLNGSGGAGSSPIFVSAPCPSSTTYDSDHPHSIDFNEIRQKCERNDVFDSAMFSPSRFIQHRRACWPDINRVGMGAKLSAIYDGVRATGLPNAMEANIPLPSNLNLHMWEQELSLPGEDHQLLQLIKYGFPLGYAGPVSSSSGIDNHRSANDFPEQVGKFIDTEIALDAVHLWPVPTSRVHTKTSPVARLIGPFWASRGRGISTVI